MIVKPHITKYYIEYYMTPDAIRQNGGWGNIFNYMFSKFGYNYDMKTYEEIYIIMPTINTFQDKNGIRVRLTIEMGLKK